MCPAASEQKVFESENLCDLGHRSNNKPQPKHRLGTVSNKLLCVWGWGGGLHRFYVATTLALGSAEVHKHIGYSIGVKDSSVHQDRKHIN